MRAPRMVLAAAESRVAASIRSSPHLRMRSRVPLAVILACALLSACGPDAPRAEPAPRTASTSAMAPTDWERALDVPPDVDPALALLIGERAAAVRASAGKRAAQGAALLELGMLLDAGGLFDRALLAYAAARERGAGARAAYHEARMLVEAGEHEAALQALAHAIEAEPRYAPAHWRRGVWLLELGRAAQARAAFARARELDPQDANAWLGEARAALALDEPERAVEAAEHVLAQRPEHGYARHLLASAWRALGEHARAEEQALRATPTPSFLGDPWELEMRDRLAGYMDLMAEAQLDIQRGNAAPAVTALEQALRERPDDVTLQGLLSAALVEAGRSDEAVALLEAARSRAPRHFRIELNLAIVQAKRGALEQALAHNLRALELHPNFGPGYLHLALLRLRMREPEAALAAVEQCLARGGENAKARALQGRIERGRGEYARAAECFERATRAAPDQAGLWYDLAEMRLMAGQVEPARSAFARARELAPNDERAVKLQQALSEASR
jgi:superkiller protein 3